MLPADEGNYGFNFITDKYIKKQKSKNILNILDGYNYSDEERELILSCIFDLEEKNILTFNKKSYQKIKK